MNRQVEVTWRTLRTVTHTLMVHSRVPEVYVHFALMYMTDHIFQVLPIKDLINEDGDPDPFCTSCKISSMNKKARYKLPLKPKAPFKWFLKDIIPSTAPKSLTNDTNFKNYLLIVDAYSKIPKLYGMENITTEEVMEKLDMFQSRFGKLTNLAVNSAVVIFSMP